MIRRWEYLEPPYGKRELANISRVPVKRRANGGGRWAPVTIAVSPVGLDFVVSKLSMTADRNWAEAPVSTGS